jgi:hypothetical protein
MRTPPIIRGVGEREREKPAETQRLCGEYYLLYIFSLSIPLFLFLSSVHLSFNLILYVREVLSCVEQ